MIRFRKINFNIWKNNLIVLAYDENMTGKKLNAYKKSETELKWRTLFNFTPPSPLLGKSKGLLRRRGGRCEVVLKTYILWIISWLVYLNSLSLSLSWRGCVIIEKTEVAATKRSEIQLKAQPEGCGYQLILNFSHRLLKEERIIATTLRLWTIENKKWL